MSDTIDQDGIVSELGRVVFSEPPSPLAPEFALKPDDVKPARSGPWFVAGEWKWREFGREVQLRNKRLPHLTLDLFRTEAEALYAALAFVLSKPMPLPYRAPWFERLKMWLARRTWNRKHAAEQAEARKALIAEFMDRSPWG